MKIVPTNSFLAELKVPGYATAPIEPAATPAFVKAVDGVLTTLTPKLDALKGQGLVAGYDFNQYLKPSGLGTIDVNPERADAAKQALQGLDEIATLWPNSQVTGDV